MGIESGPNVIQVSKTINLSEPRSTNSNSGGDKTGHSEGGEHGIQMCHIVKESKPNHPTDGRVMVRYADESPRTSSNETARKSQSLRLMYTFAETNNRTSQCEKDASDPVSQAPLSETMVQNHLNHAKDEIVEHPIVNPFLMQSRAVERPVGYASQDGTFFFNGKPLLNAAVRILEIRQYEKQSEYHCSVIVGGLYHEFSVPVSEFSDGKWLKKVPGLRTFLPKNEYNSCIYMFLNELISAFNGPITTLKQGSGWYQANNEYIFVTPSGVIGRPELRIFAAHGPHLDCVGQHCQQAFLDVINMKDITPGKATASFLMLYTVLSSLYSLFKLANALPKFTLFICGKGGSYKTSIALAITQLENRREPEFTMKATSSGLEAGFREFRDAVMLIDDLAPVSDRAEERRMKGNLELIIRAFGDGTGKRRNLDFIDQSARIQQYRAEGGAVITGEYIAGGRSSLARSIFLKCDEKSVDVQRLSYYQRQNAIAAFLPGFLRWVSENTPAIIQRISCDFESYRSQSVGRFSNPRYSEYQAQLQIITDILLCYGMQLGFINQSQEIAYRNWFSCIASETILENDVSLRQSALDAKIALALKAILNSGEMDLMPVEQLSLNPQTIYYSEQMFYFPSKITSKLIIESISSEIGRVGENTLRRQMVESGLVQTVQEGAQRRNAVKLEGKGSMRFFSINRQRLSELIGGNI